MTRIIAIRVDYLLARSHLQLLPLWSSDETMVVQEGRGSLQLAQATIIFNVVRQFVGDGSCKSEEFLVDCADLSPNLMSERQLVSNISGLIVSRESSSKKFMVRCMPASCFCPYSSDWVSGTVRNMWWQRGPTH